MVVTGKARTMERLRRVARRARAAVAEQLAGDQELPGRIEGFARTDQPAIAVHVGHVMGGKQNRIVAGAVQCPYVP